jgi:hypothetical protein
MLHGAVPVLSHYQSVIVSAKYNLLNSNLKWNQLLWKQVCVYTWSYIVHVIYDEILHVVAYATSWFSVYSMYCRWMHLLFITCWSDQNDMHYLQTVRHALMELTIQSYIYVNISFLVHLLAFMYIVARLTSKACIPGGKIYEILWSVTWHMSL